MDNFVILEYIWLDSNNNFRSKTKVMTDDTYTNLPIWNYDGSSTGQAEGSDSEVFLKPTVTFCDPFRRHEKCYLVWCDMIDKYGNALPNSNRNKALNIFNKYKNEEAWFGLEQEYFIIDPKTKHPVDFNIMKPQGEYYCGVGVNNAICRQLPETHLEHCLYAGINICGLNAEVAPSQWEYQIGPCSDIEAGDHLWVSRYILNRIAENLGYEISYHPKPLGELADWNGSGCHTNFSTKELRDENGIQSIYKAINRLSKNHFYHMVYYGKDNKLRLSGRHETSSYDKFTFGRANRNASIRIPNSVLSEMKGYFEDRRPAANCDPYLVTSLILETCMNPEFDVEKVPKSSSFENLAELGYIV